MLSYGRGDLNVKNIKGNQKDAKDISGGSGLLERSSLVLLSLAFSDRV